MAENQSVYENSPVYDWPKILGHKKNTEEKECRKETNEENINTLTASGVDRSSCEDPIQFISNSIAASFREQLGKNLIFFLSDIINHI